MKDITETGFQHERRISSGGAPLGCDIGQAFVELALVLPIFVILLLGVAEVGRLAYASIEVSNAARAGASYAAQNHITASNSLDINNAAKQDAPEISGIAATATQLCSCTNGTVITCANAGVRCISPGRIIESVQVNTSASVNTLFHLPGIPNQVTLTGQAIMMVEQ
jgi:Flp pilus assembly protein TadG